MAFLVAAVVVLAVLCLGNLLLLFAVLRRLRGYEERLAAGSSRRPVSDELVGRRLPAPAAELVGRTRLVGVFSASCQPCHEQAALFARHDDPERVAVVLDGSADAERRSAMLAALAGAPAVLTGPDSGTVAGGLGISTYPVLLRLDGDGTVVAAGHSLASLTAVAR